MPTTTVLLQLLLVILVVVALKRRKSVRKIKPRGRHASRAAREGGSAGGRGA